MKRWLLLLTLLVWPSAAHATFPSVVRSQGGDTANTTTHTISLTSANSGDLRVVSIACRGGDASNQPSWPAGWTQLYNTNTGTDTFDIWTSSAYKISTGETSVAPTTSGNSGCAWSELKITAWHGSSAPEAGTAATGFSTTPDPPNVAPSWGSGDNLFIAVIGWSGTGSTISSSPFITNYSQGNQQTANSGTADAVSIGSAERNLTASSDNPGTATLTGSEPWVANTIVVRPAAAATTSPGIIGGGIGRFIQ